MTIKEIEDLRDAVIKKHFNHSVSVYFNQQYYMEQHSIDQKVLYYIALNITAKDILDSICHNQKRNT